MEYLKSQIKKHSDALLQADLYASGAVLVSVNEFAEFIKNVSLFMSVPAAAYSYGNTRAAAAELADALRNALAVLHECISLLPEVYKTSSPTDGRALQATLEVMINSLVAGSSADGTRIKELLATLSWNPSIQNRATLGAARGRELIADALRDERSALSAMESGNILNSQFDAPGAAYTSVTGEYFPRLTGNANGGNYHVMPIPAFAGRVGPYVQQLGPDVWRYFSCTNGGDAAISAYFANARVSVAVTVEQPTVASQIIDAAGANCARVFADDATLATWANAIRLNTVAPIRRNPNPSAGVGQTVFFSSSIVGPGTLTVTFPASAGATDVVTGLIIVLRSTTETFQQDLFGGVDAGLRLENVVGRVALDAVSGLDMSRIDRYLQLVGAYNRFVLSGQDDTATKPMGDVLSQYAANRFGKTYVFDEISCMTLEHWLCGVPGVSTGTSAAGTFSWNEWAAMYRQWTRLLPIYAAGAMSSEQFVYEYSRDEA